MEDSHHLENQDMWYLKNRVWSN